MKYDALITAIADAHQEVRQEAVGAVKRHLTLRNWLVDSFIKEYEQNGEDRAAYGTRLLVRLSTDLKSQSVSGVSPDMLERMRLLHNTYPQLQSDFSAPAERKFNQDQPIPLPSKKILKFSWMHLAELVRLDDPWKHAFYKNESLKGNWSKRQLQGQIGSLLCERTGLSSDKDTVINLARGHACESPQSVTDIVRDPYILDFTGLAGRPSYLKKDLETALLDHLQTFLLEPCNGFCFEARKSAFPSATRTTTSILSFTTAFSAATSSLN